METPRKNPDIAAHGTREDKTGETSTFDEILREYSTSKESSGSRSSVRRAEAKRRVALLIEARFLAEREQLMAPEAELMAQEAKLAKKRMKLAILDVEKEIYRRTDKEELELENSKLKNEKVRSVKKEREVRYTGYQECKPPKHRSETLSQEKIVKPSENVNRLQKPGSSILYKDERKRNEDNEVIEIQNETISVKGNHEVVTPLENCTPVFSDSKMMAEERSQPLSEMLEKTNDSEEQYCKEMNDEGNECDVKILEDEMKKDDHEMWYQALQLIRKPEEKNVRPEFCCIAHVYHSNQMVQESILMSRQVKVPEKDVLRYPWRPNDTSQEPKTDKMTTDREPGLAGRKFS